MNNDFAIENTSRCKKTPMIIVILLTAGISFFTGMLFGKNENMSFNTSSITAKMKNTILPNNNKNTIGSKFKNKIAEKIKQANGIEEDDYIEEEENEIDLQIQPVEPQTTNTQNDEQASLQAKLRENLIKQEASQTQQVETDSITATTQAEQNINNSIILNNDEDKTDNSSTINKIQPKEQPIIDENQQKHTDINTSNDKMDVSNKDRVYVVMVNNNSVNNSSTTDKQNIVEKNNKSVSKTLEQSKTQKQVNTATKKPNNATTKKVSKKQPVKQKSKQNTSTKKQVANKKMTTKKTAQTEAKKQPQVNNIVKQNNSQETINNTDKSSTKEDDVETEELIIELDNNEDIQKLQNVDVETLIVVDNETGEEYEIVPDSTNTNKENKTGK